MEKSISPLFPGPRGDVVANDWCIIGVSSYWCIGGAGTIIKVVAKISIYSVIKIIHYESSGV